MNEWKFCEEFQTPYWNAPFEWNKIERQPVVGYVIHIQWATEMLTFIISINSTRNLQIVVTTKSLFGCIVWSIEYNCKIYISAPIKVNVHVV